MAISEPWV